MIPLEGHALLFNRAHTTYVVDIPNFYSTPMLYRILSPEHHHHQRIYLFCGVVHIMKIMPWLPAHLKTIGKVIVVDRIFYQQSHFYLFPLWMPIGTYRPTPYEIKKWVLSIHYLQYAFRLQHYITTLNLTFSRGLGGLYLTQTVV